MNNEQRDRHTTEIMALADRLIKAGDSQMSYHKMVEFIGILMRERHYDLLVAGDLVECGVWRGASAALLGKAFEGLHRAIHLYDTFAGMPAPTQKDFTQGDQSVPGRVAGDGGSFGAGSLADTSVERVWQLLKGVAGVGLQHEDIFLHKGLISGPESFSNAPEQIAILHIDLDFYEPYKVTLDTLYPRVSPGGLIIFDDYGHFIGAKRAVDEFCQRTGEEIYSPDGTSRRCIRRSKS